MEKLGRVLEGTKLDASKLSQIERKKAKYISRNDLLTLSFLAYMSRVEKVREEQGSLAEEDYEGRKGGFFSITNEILRKSGYYELYTPNPYDSLLVLLVSSNEGIVSYRNLWSMYLTWKKKKEEEEGEV